MLPKISAFCKMIVHMPTSYQHFFANNNSSFLCLKQTYHSFVCEGLSCFLMDVEHCIHRTRHQGFQRKKQRRLLSYEHRDNFTHLTFLELPSLFQSFPLLKNYAGQWFSSTQSQILSRSLESELSGFETEKLNPHVCN